MLEQALRGARAEDSSGSGSHRQRTAGEGAHADVGRSRRRAGSPLIFFWAAVKMLGPEFTASWWRDS